MAQDNSNSTMEMGTSDQVLVPSKTKKTTYIIGFIAMVAVIAGVIVLVVLLSGNEGGNAESIVATPAPITPSSVLPPSPITEETTTSLPSPSPTTTEDPNAVTDGSTELPIVPTEPPAPAPLDLDDIINGVYSPASFNATFTSGNDLLFRNENGDLVLYDIDTDSTMPLISNSTELLQRSSRVTLLAPDGNHVVLAYSVQPLYRYSFFARYTVYSIVTGNLTEIVPPALLRNEEAYLQNFQWGPTGTSLAFVYNNNIYYQASLESPPQQITDTGLPDVIYNGIPDWVYEEEVFGSNNALWFSNDGNKLAYVTFNDTDVRVMRVPHYGTPGSIAHQYTFHHEIRYPKSGTTNPTVSVTLRDLNNNQDYVYNAPTDLNQPILKTVSFVTNDSIAVMWTNRVQTTLRVMLCIHGQAACSQIYQYEEREGWIDNIPLIFNDLGTSFITILPQAVDGVLYKQIVQVSNVNAQSWTNEGRSNTPHTVSEILSWTSDDIVWYKATRVNDSAELHIYSVDSSGVVNCFTCSIRRPDGGECLYNDATISASGERLAITCAGPDVPQVYIYNTANNGTLVRVWEDNADMVNLMANHVLPQTLRLSIPVADGLPDADVLLQVPANYENMVNVPLLVYVYGGPDSAQVTKLWNIDWGSSLVSRWNISVAQIDGRGSGLRGVANMFAVNRALGTVEIADQINVTRALHERLPWLDSNRTCIWGWSYGGYAASLALARGGNVFRCAAAVAPVVDWRFYDSIYTERYMDVPSENLQAYEQSSLLNAEVAEAFRNKSYFLIHGTADDNVHYQHAMLISRMLQRRDVFFTQMSYTDEDHGLFGVRPHLYHGLEKFLQDKML